MLKKLNYDNMEEKKKLAERKLENSKPHLNLGNESLLSSCLKRKMGI